MSKYSLHHSDNFLGLRLERKYASQPADEDRAYSTPLLRFPQEKPNQRSPSLPTPPLLPSHSTPSVVLPSTRRTLTAPVPLRKRAFTLNVGCSSKPLEDEDMPSPSKRTARCPTLNLLFNAKRNGSPSPESHVPVAYNKKRSMSPSPRSPTPAMSTPKSSFVSIGRPSDELSPTSVTTPSPPVLSLPADGSMDVSLGLDDEFGITSCATTPPPRLFDTPFSHSSKLSSWSQSSWSQPPSPSPRSAAEYPTSSSRFFSSSGPPVVMPSATAVLEAACSDPGAPGRPNSVAFPGDSSSEDTSRVVDSPTREFMSTPPRLAVHLRRSSEDWANAVLMAVRKPVESLA